MRGLLLVLLVFTPSTLFAQDRDATLADIRRELGVLSVELQGLKRELAESEAVKAMPEGTGPLERLDAIERELKRLTANTEELGFRIERIVADGTNRLGDLEFRLLELEGGDLSQAGNTLPLGGEVGEPAAPKPQPDGTVELAVGERGDFEAAMELLEAGTPADAYTALSVFVETYPRSPLAAEAHLFRGEALSLLGNEPDAGRAYLEAYTLAEKVDPGLAAEALFKLGGTLENLGQTDEACLTLRQVGIAFPGTAASQNAQQKLDGMTCL